MRKGLTQHLRHAILLLHESADSVQNDKMPPPLPIVRMCPVSVDTQSGVSLRPRCHLVGRRWVRFLWLRVHCKMPIVAIPVGTDVGGDDVSHRVETISDKVPIIAVRIEKILQELVILRRP